MQHTLRVGGTLPLLFGAGPRLLLSTLPDEQVEHYLAGPLQRRTSPRQAAAEQLRDEVKRIGRAGFGTGRDDVDLGVKALGVLVHDHPAPPSPPSVRLIAHMPDSDQEHQLLWCASRRGGVSGHGAALGGVGQLIGRSLRRCVNLSSMAC